MPPKILHVSDVHARPGILLDDVAAGIAAALKAEPPDCVVCTGDLGHKGKHHLLGAEFVCKIADLLDISRVRVVFSPGNHDLEGSSLLSYRSAVARVLNREDSSASSASLYLLDDLTLVLVNSVHHGDHTFGHVDAAQLSGLVPGADRPAVLAMHHHCFGAGDTSNVRNAHEFFAAIAALPVKTVLHGHRHIALSLALAKANILGVGSATSPPGANLNSQFNVVVPGESVTRYRFIEDAEHEGSHWIPSAESL